MYKTTVEKSPIPFRMKIPIVFTVVLAGLAGAFMGWMSVLAGIWFTMPIFLICAAIVSISLDSAFRWRLAAFSVGIVVVFSLEVRSFVEGVETQQKIQKSLEKEKLNKKPQATPPAIVPN